jgi:hypothetical protein
MSVIIDNYADPVTIATQPIVIANFQFGSTIDGLVLETSTSSMTIGYAEFMQMMYSSSGELVYRPSARQTREFLLVKYESPTRNCIPTYRFASEDMPLTSTNLLSSANLHNLVNGPFKAVMNITMISNVLQFGIKNKVVINVTSAPYSRALNICNSHIYEIVVVKQNNCNCDC